MMLTFRFYHCVCLGLLVMQILSWLCFFPPTFSVITSSTFISHVLYWGHIKLNISAILEKRHIKDNVKENLNMLR